MPAVSPSKYLVTATWDDAPHLDEDTKRELLAGIPEYQRDARSKGIPSLGSGAIYPVALSEVVVKPFAIPDYWPRCYGLDVGWNRTAAVWIAQDPIDKVRYAYTEHYMGQGQPTLHAEAIKARGKWVPGAIDPASRGRSQDEGKQLFAQYLDLGLDIVPARNGVEPGIYQVWTMLGTGQLRIFSTCTNLQAEYRMYRRDDSGRVVKEHDHLMDALRYAIVMFDDIAKVRPIEQHSTRADIGDRHAGY